MMQPSELETKNLSSTKPPNGRPIRPTISKPNTGNHGVNNSINSINATNSSPERELPLTEKNLAENGLTIPPISAKTADVPTSDISSPENQENHKNSHSNKNNNISNNLEIPSPSGNNGGESNTPTVSRGFLPVLKNRNFLALWGGQVFCQLADKIYLVLMVALITQFQRGDEPISGWVSALMIASTIPAILFGSVAGVFVDRWSKKVVLVATNIWRGLLVLGIPVLFWLTRDWHSLFGLPVGFIILLGLTFAVSTLTQFFAPAEQAAIPLIVDEGNLLSANSLYTTTMMASVIIGFAVGEPLLVAVENLWTNLGGIPGLGREILVGGSYAIAGIILSLLVTNEKEHPKAAETPHVFADLRDGFNYINEKRPLRNAIIQLVILFSVFAALTVLAIKLSVITGLKPEQFGFLLAAGGVGMAIGAMLLGQFGERFLHGHLSTYSCLGIAAALAGLSVFTSNLWLVLLCVASIGIFGAFVGIPMQTAIQTQTPPEMRGKVFGLQNNVINIALSLPLALAGVMETLVGLKPVFLGLAAIVLMVSIFTWYNSPEVE